MSSISVSRLAPATARSSVVPGGVMTRRGFSHHPREKATGSVRCPNPPVMPLVRFVGYTLPPDPAGGIAGEAKCARGARMADADTIEISRSMAIKIADLLKAELTSLETQLEQGRANRVGETALNILMNKKKTLRVIYDELKAAGAEAMDATIDMLEPPGSSWGR